MNNFRLVDQHTPQIWLANSSYLYLPILMKISSYRCSRVTRPRDPKALASCHHAENLATSTNQPPTKSPIPELHQIAYKNQ
ncbi:hypothetical protein BO82DRAFT_67210 [Aspergillus uvarum CBS 121591]|uniref:Uncharacterized protein n=1 Tax=Aspergillus uvarum CBS 121591 TaxID=1448315 RepID=A0A319CCT2_9EURO|nr:hypothetical protein BO82DRAFT_67210 [Aspergillus uvarum CBS 121591]PYH82079.1 hypothetical protein BO82DRAFT_67210 [Aspergillus uvarum CBS 121591]